VILLGGGGGEGRGGEEIALQLCPGKGGYMDTLRVNTIIIVH
jgi:hypothetical protein